MFGHKISGFLGLVPRASERLLPDMGAQIAENVNLTSGEIMPIRLPFVVHAPGTIGNYFAAYRAEYNGTEKWRVWDKDIDVIRGPLSPDVEPRYYWTGDGCPRYSTFTNFGSSEFALGIPSPTVQSTVSHAGGTGSAVSRSYCYTFYQPATGEETGPASPSAIITGKVDGTWTISGFSNTPANTRAANFNTSGLKQRLYRTAGNSASWQLVAERAVSTSDWTDTLSDSAILGDELISSGWDLPPVGMKGIIVLPNGSAVGFYGNQILYSDPYQMHAWPLAFRYQVESEIVGIAAYGTTVIVCTKTRPFVATGVTPESVTVESFSEVWPCLSKQSVCSVGDGVVFATRHGLAYLGQSGNDIITKGLYTADEWYPLNPSSMTVRIADGRIFIAYIPDGGAARQLMRLDMGEAAQLTSFAGDCNTLFVDPLNGKLYLVSDKVYLFDGTYGSRNTFVWKSKQIELAEPVNFGAALIEWKGTMTATEVQAAYSQFIADQVANQAAINDHLHVGAFGQVGFNTDPINGSSSIVEPSSPAETLEYTLFDHGLPVFTKKVISGQAFRLPGGYKSDVIAHQLVGNVSVRYIKIAESMVGLKAL